MDISQKLKLHQKVKYLKKIKYFMLEDTIRLNYLNPITQKILKLQ